MKRFLCLFVLLLAGVVTLCAQYAPNTRWPYLYENFTKGTLFFADNQKSEAQLNIHLWGNVLHYITQDGKVFESTDPGIARVEIGGDAYLYYDRRLMKLVGNRGRNLLLRLDRADFDKMFAATGAYGSSLTSSASRDLSSLDLGGLDKPELGKMLQEKEDGREIPMETEYCFVIGDRKTDASRKAVEELVGPERQEEWKKFLKENKIKWKKEESLLQVLDFFGTR